VRDDPSRTAEAVCLFRATDQRRAPSDRILDDPYAKLFLGPVMRAALATIEATGRLGTLAEQYAPGLLTYVLCRHRYIDDCLATALHGPVAQVVLLGAGYDTRAYRFASSLHGRPVFELDVPATSRRKARIVEEHARELPHANVRRVEIDFVSGNIEEALIAAGFQRDARTFFVWEGVAMYLPRSAVKDTLARIRDLGAVGSALAMDFWYLLDATDLLSTAYRSSASLLSLVGEPVVFALHPEDASPFMRRAGFEIVDIADTEELRHRYVRDGRHVFPGNYVLEARTVSREAVGTPAV